MNKEILEQAGFSKGEVEVYTILLKIGESTASDIAKHSKIARPNIYDYLNKLREKGMIGFITKSGKLRYIPASPNKILNYLEEKTALIKEDLPNLLKLYNQDKEKNIVEVYESVGGYKTLMNDIIKNKENFVGWGASDKVKEVVPDYVIERYIKQRESKGIKARLIFSEKEGVLKTSLSEFKSIPKEFTSPSTTIIYGEKVAIMIYTPIHLIIIIRSSTLAKSYKNHFELLWKLAKKIV